MSSFLDKLTGKSHSDNNANNTNNNNNNNSNSHSANSSSSSSSNSSSSMSSTKSSTTGSTTSGPYVSGSAGATNPGLVSGSNTSTTQQTTNRQGGMAGQTGMAGQSGMYNNNNQRQGMGSHNQGMTDDAITRSEEQLRVGKETIGAGTARLDKYVTSEHVNTSVPVTKERVVIEREPINDSNRDKALDGPDISEAHHEVHLTEERAMAQKEVVPIERIRLGKQVETHDQQVGTDLRKEHVDLTTTGINEKFDNVGYGKTTGTPATTTGNTNENQAMMGKNSPAGNRV